MAMVPDDTGAPAVEGAEGEENKTAQSSEAGQGQEEGEEEANSGDSEMCSDAAGSTHNKTYVGINIGAHHQFFTLTATTTNARAIHMHEILKSCAAKIRRLTDRARLLSNGDLVDVLSLRE